MMRLPKWRAGAMDRIQSGGEEKRICALLCEYLNNNLFSRSF